MIKRFIYFGYYLKTLDANKLSLFMRHVSQKHNRTRLSLWKDIFRDSIKYNISILDYFLFRFYEISEKEKESYVGTGYMYEYQLLMNPLSSREILDNKLIFLSKYKDFIHHSFASYKEIVEGNSDMEELLNDKDQKIVLKNSRGQCGEGIEIRQVLDFNKDELLNRLKETKNDFVEEYVVQHDFLNKLSPSGLNTIRVITQVNRDNDLHILGARLRITVNSPVDNLAAGNLAAPINLDTGVIEGPGVYSDITKADEEIHPVTGEEIVGFKVPFWNEILDMVERAALFDTSNKSIGWDIAVTNYGPELIEANHDWCKWLWQLPVKRGLKPILEKHKREFKK